MDTRRLYVSMDCQRGANHGKMLVGLQWSAIFCLFTQLQCETSTPHAGRSKGVIHLLDVVVLCVTCLLT